MTATFEEIQALKQLFKTNTKKNDSSDESDNEGQCYNRPSSTTVEEQEDPNAPKKPNPYAKLEPEKNRNREVEDPDDITQFLEDEKGDKIDWRKTPKWKISYRQKVSASDVFLQMGNKNPSTASCETMIIEVFLPGEKRQNMDLKILTERLELITPNFRLDVPLPQPVDPQKGNAQWDKDEEKLIVNLEMEREFDFLNF